MYANIVILVVNKANVVLVVLSSIVHSVITNYFLIILAIYVLILQIVQIHK